MDQATYDLIGKDENFLKLVRKRRRFVWLLAGIIFFAYYSFILIVAFKPSFLSQKIGDSLITFGMPYGIGIIFLSFILTGVYVKRANGEFDALIEKIKNRIKTGQ